MEPIQGLTKRLNYQRMFSDGKIVNIGCGEDPAQLGDEAVHVDLDVYSHKKFIQADAHHLPFKDFEFDTAVLGDMLEHTPDPVQVLREAGRVARKVVATIYEENRLAEAGSTVKEYVEYFNNNVHKTGYRTYFDYLKSLPGHKDKIVSVTPDDQIPHHPHIHEFKDEDIRRMVSEAGLELRIYHKYQEGEHEGKPVMNWLIVAGNSELMYHPV